MITCEEHDDCIVVSDRPFCPVCREIEILTSENKRLDEKVDALKEENARVTWAFEEEMGQH